MRVFLLLVFLALPAAGQEPDAARLAAARALVETANMPRQIDATIQVLRGYLAQQFRQRSPQLSEEAALAVVDEYIVPEIRDHGAEVAEAAITTYARHLTVPEMEQIAAFQRSPIGQRFADVAPLINADIVRFSQAWGNRVVQQALNKHRDALRARGVNL